MHWGKMRLVTLTNLRSELLEVVCSCVWSELLSAAKCGVRGVASADEMLADRGYSSLRGGDGQVWGIG